MIFSINAYPRYVQLTVTHTIKTIINMNFIEELGQLQKDIAKYLTIHNNPHDTSKHDPYAKKLIAANPVLEKAAPPPPRKTINNSVGKNGKNEYNDVKLVQELLGIKADGHAGPKTNLAIRKFQRSLGFKKTDGRIDPKGITWQNLSKRITSNPSEETTTDTDSNTALASKATEIKASVGKKGTNQLDDVILVQQLLKLTPDGKCGLKTIRAIKEFQQSIGLPKPDGRIDPNGFTWKKLNAQSVPPDQTTSGSAKSLTGSVGKNGDNHVNDVKLVQQLLHEKGAHLDIDGDAGPGTIEAIEAFQAKLGVANPDGRVDPNGFTWKELNKVTPHDNPHDEKMVVTTGDAPLPEELSVTSKIKKSVGHKGTNLPEDVLLVRKLLIKFNYNLKEDTTIDIPLVSAIKRFQKEFVGSSKPDGRIDANGKTWNTLLGIGRIRGGIYDVAKKYGIEVAVILAIQAVESGGNGFLPDGRPKILFEGHIFWRELKKAGKNPAALQKGNENIIYPKWVKTNYKWNEREYDRLELAKKIDKTAALKSTSWGEFQIMGFNYASAGYSNVESFVEAMYQPGINQLGGLMGFLKDNNLIRHVQGPSKNWAALAKGYNGPAYAKNKYDIKLANAYKRFSQIV